jgi:hypothetical protein
VPPWISFSDRDLWADSREVRALHVGPLRRHWACCGLFGCEWPIGPLPVITTLTIETAEELSRERQQDHAQRARRFWTLYCCTCTASGGLHPGPGGWSRGGRQTQRSAGGEWQGASSGRAVSLPATCRWVQNAQPGLGRIAHMQVARMPVTRCSNI